MAEIEGFIGTSTSHCRHPSLYVDAISRIANAQWGAGASNKLIWHSGGPLLDVAACIARLEQEARPIRLDGSILTETLNRRMLGIAVKHSLGCIRKLWEFSREAVAAFVPLGGVTVPDSFRELLQRMHRYGTLPATLRSALDAAKAPFGDLRRLRDGIWHQHDQHLLTMHEGELYLHVAQGSLDVIGRTHREGGLTWYRVTSILRDHLEAWLTFWHEISDQLPDPRPARNQWMFCAPTMLSVAKLLGAGDVATTGWSWIWPCSDDCIGSFRGCENDPGLAPDGLFSVPMATGDHDRL